MDFFDKYTTQEKLDIKHPLVLSEVKTNKA